MAVATASTQWSRAKLSKLDKFKHVIFRDIWGSKRQMRCAEIFGGVLCNAPNVAFYNCVAEEVAADGARGGGDRNGSGNGSVEDTGHC